VQIGGTELLSSFIMTTLKQDDNKNVNSTNMAVEGIPSKAIWDPSSSSSVGSLAASSASASVSSSTSISTIATADWCYKTHSSSETRGDDNVNNIDDEKEAIQSITGLEKIVKQEEKEDISMGTMLMKSINHHHGGTTTSSSCSNLGNNNKNNNNSNDGNTEQLISQEDERYKFIHSKKNKHKWTETSLRVQLWDAFRLTRVILGQPIQDTKISHNSILHSIRKVAEMKIQIIHMSEQIDYYQQKQKYKKRKQQRYANNESFSSSSSTSSSLMLSPTTKKIPSIRDVINNDKNNDNVSLLRQKAIQVLQTESNLALNQLKDLDEEVEKYKQQEDNATPTECSPTATVTTTITATNPPPFISPSSSNDTDDSDEYYNHNYSNGIGIGIGDESAAEILYAFNNTSSNRQQPQPSQQLSSTQQQQIRDNYGQQQGKIMMDELYTNLITATNTITTDTDILQALHEQLAVDTMTTTIATAESEKKILPHHPDSYIHHPRERAMMTLLEASLPPTKEIKHILKRLNEIQQRQAKQEMDEKQQQHQESSSAVVAATISILSRLLQCQTKMEKTRIVMMEQDDDDEERGDDSCWYDRWCTIKEKEIETDEILQFMDLQRQVLFNDIKLMKISNNNSDNSITNSSTAAAAAAAATTSSTTITNQQQHSQDDDDNYSRILLCLEESEYQKQIGLMIQNEQNKIKEIDSLEIELTKMAFVAIKLEQQQQEQQGQQEEELYATYNGESEERRRRQRLEDVNGLHVQTQTHINALQVLRNNIQNHIEEQTIKVFGDDMCNSSSDREESDAVVDVKVEDDKKLEEGAVETADAKIQRLESLLTKKNIELFTTNAELKVTKQKLLLASSSSVKK
jgi:hypothetical protein